MQMKHQNEKNMNQQLQNIRRQQMFKVPASGPNTRPQPSSPLVNCIVNDRLLHVCPVVNEASGHIQAALSGSDLKFSFSDNPLQIIL